MNKKAFKALIINNGGEIINNKKFQYRGIIYYYYYFVKDSKQWTLKLKKPYMKLTYKSEVIICSEYGVINDEYNKNKEYYDDSLSESFDWLGVIYQIILWLISICLFLILSHKNKYDDLDTRIKTLELWSSTCPIYYKKSRLFKKNKKNNAFTWAFKRIMINDYAKRENEKIILTLDNFKVLKKIWIKTKLLLINTIKNMVNDRWFYCF